MKNIKITLFILFSSIYSQAQFLTAEIGINGLTCSMCSYSVEKSILKLPFVADIKMDLNSNIAYLEFNERGKVNFFEIAEKVEDAGFSVGHAKTEINRKLLPDVLTEYFKIGNQSFYILGNRKLIDTELVKIHFLGQYFKGKSEGKNDEKEMPASVKSAYKKRELYPVAIEN